MSASFVPPAGQEESLDRMADADKYNEWLLGRARPLAGNRVLDFGAGSGTFTAAFAEHARVVAVEPDPGLAARLRQRFDSLESVTVVEGDDSWLETDEAQGQFDTVICFNVLEHIRDDLGVLRGFHRCLVPGGRLLLLVPAHSALYGSIDQNVGHERRYSRALIRERLASAGLVTVEARYVNPLGAVGWLVSSRMLGRDQVPSGPLRIYDLLVPALRPLDRLPLPFGLSVWTVARRDDAA